MVTYNEALTGKKPPGKEPNGRIAGTFKIQKSVDEKRLAFGWASVAATAAGDTVTDYYEDIIEPDELEQAAYNFVQFYREGGEMHERGPERIERAGADIAEDDAENPHHKADAQGAGFTAGRGRCHDVRNVPVEPQGIRWTRRRPQGPPPGASPDRARPIPRPPLKFLCAPASRAVAAMECTRTRSWSC